MSEHVFYVIVLVALIAFNLIQFHFYSRELQKLVNKLMSRNFGEYQRNETQKVRTSPRIDEQAFEEKPPEGLFL